MRATVAVALPTKEAFHYVLPARLAAHATIGLRVLIPFRNRKEIGYILETTPYVAGAGTKEIKEIKEIEDILDEEPLFHAGVVPLFKWMADYYRYPIGRLIQSALPGSLRITHFRAARITASGLRALEHLPAQSEARRALAWIEAHPGRRIPKGLPVDLNWQKRGWIVVEHVSEGRRALPKMRKYVRPREGQCLESLLREQAALLRAKNEVEFLQTLFGSHGMPKAELAGRFGNGAYLTKKWLQKGFLEEYSVIAPREPSQEIIAPPPPPRQLHQQQERVLRACQRRLEEGRFATCLLHGVTGSGKTEVYYRAIEHAARLGRQSILMVPEIALAVYMESVFRSRLGEKVAIYHSGLSGGEKSYQWSRMAKGEVDLVIGARSALFAPVPRLGLIIVDEEHDSSYKQEEAPRYQARDAAVVRAKMEQALVILGSGTPSVQSYHNAVTGRYEHLVMPERIEQRPLPDFQVMDMKSLADKQKRNGLISPQLRAALDDELLRGRQAILFLNRRGFDRLHLCRACGHAIRCRNCDLAMVYHLQKSCLVCHYCGLQSTAGHKCPACGGQSVGNYGFGTEKLEQELVALYPDRNVARMDRDSTRRKGQAIQILRRFSEHKIDVLVGTQMITKGYDFPNVTLVGVIAADLSLGFPDFRAAERTYQLLTQVAGRAGRGDQRGRVIVQTFNPEHYAISSAREYDFASFYEKEKALRVQLGYPPFAYLACLRLQGNNQDVTADKACQVGQGIEGILERWPKRGREIQVLGPVEAPITKLKGKYRWQILVKSKQAGLLHKFLDRVEGMARKSLRSSGVSMVVDVDPYQML
jgi:primosomal protein N' (replication factor Y)